ncbi:hypothetical protein SASPL_100276 [Salvia splendens]|uniref:Uncharacterized protein n=1 Tax=Salvia splendens TaxID=180675 RepID=A0A8X9ABF7_SALSN|nr:hypothetical protein SASPL_100276 [Salvia splendens]
MSLSRHLLQQGPIESTTNSWKPPRNPKEGNRQLALLRRDYGRQLKQIRKDYINEMELQRIEKLRKDTARKEALRIANEEGDWPRTRRRRQRPSRGRLLNRSSGRCWKIARIQMKERAEKLGHWRMREKKIEEQKKEKKEILRRQSSKWIDEPDLVKTAMNNVF